jgi:hypothetical protein
MVGAVGEPAVPPRRPTGHDGHVPADDTTSALLGAPAAPPPNGAPAKATPVELSEDELDGDDDDGNDDDEDGTDERTVQQAVPPAIAAAAIAAASKARVAVAALPAPPSNHPVPGAAPPGPVREAAKTDATDITDITVDDDPIEDSITATAPRLNAANLMEAAQSGRGVPIAIPGRVEIRTLEDDDDPQDETEVRTRPGHAGLDVPSTLRAAAALPAPRPAAGRPPEAKLAALPVAEDHEVGAPDEDGVTTQAQAPRVEPLVDASDELLTRPGLGGEGDPPTRPGLEAPTEPATRPGLGGAVATSDQPTAKVKVDPNGYPNDQDDDESVTTRARSGDAEPYGEDSVTTQAPNVPLDLIHAAIKAAEAANAAALDDTSADTTQKLRKPRTKAAPSPADEEAESITTQAPGHVTNMLRVIASGSSPDLPTSKNKPIEEDDEGPENRTAVMAGAPLKRVIQEVESNGRLPAIRPTGGPLSHGPMGAAAPRLEPSSESGLRVARSGSGSNERASLGQLLASPDARNSGALVASMPIDPASLAPFDPRSLGPAEMGQLQPSLHDVNLGKGPSYGLLVAIVAVISVVVPVTLYVVLRHGTESVTQAVPSEPSTEIEKPGAPRGKSGRGKNGLTIVPSATAGASASPAPSAVPSSAPSGKPGTKGPPFGRR